ncbi:aminopeptidase B [Pteropus alecto]|uniref:aminopeptidase B n=1 Tax=Pteropus alecto TaxID=9402 RepID=UPI000D5385EE|nr:aminopeptidase B [Pteropus alecto]
MIAYRVGAARGVDPDDTYNDTPHGQGSCFVFYLALLVGDQGQFDKFFKACVLEFKLQSIFVEDSLEFTWSICSS